MLDVSRIRAISLDLDDTLWPIGPTIARAESRLQHWLAQHTPATAALFADAEVRLGLRETALARLPHQAHDLSAIRQEMIRLGLERSGADPGLAPDAFAVFFAARMEVDLFADAVPALAWLSQRYPVVALTNGNADVHRVGIGHFFTASVSAREVGVGKPHAPIFWAAAQALGFPPEQILHVGDDAELDVVGARGVGMQTAWINRGATPWAQHPPPDATASDMAALCELLAAGAAAPH